MRIFVSLIAATPFILLQLMFLKDIYEWIIFLFVYGGIIVAAPLVILYWCGYCIIEYGIRRSNKQKQLPMFSIVGGILLLTFFLPAYAIKPVLMKFPFFCRVTQIVSWETSRHKPEWKSNDNFVLVLVGKGTYSHHRFTSGYLNWTSDEPAGFSSVDFNPMSFQEDYYEKNKTGSLGYLKSRMQNSTIPDEEVDLIARDIWKVMQQIDNGKNIHTPTGEVDEVHCQIENGWDYIVGGSIWITVLTLLFLFVGFSTIKPHDTPMQKLQKNEQLY